MSSIMTYQEALRQALNEAIHDKRVIIKGGEVIDMNKNKTTEIIDGIVTLAENDTSQSNNDLKKNVYAMKEAR